MTDREGAVALYRFLSEFTQLRTTTVRDISRYEQEGQVIWAADVPRDSGCDCIAWRRCGSDAPGGDGTDEVGRPFAASPTNIPRWNWRTIPRFSRRGMPGSRTIGGHGPSATGVSGPSAKCTWSSS